MRHLLLLALLACAPHAPSDTPAPKAMARAKDPVQQASYDEVWRVMRDVYPDPTLKGLDWPAVYLELLPQAQVARSAEELRPTLLAMLARLGDSHCTIFPGAQAQLPRGLWLAEDKPPSQGELASVGLLTNVYTQVSSSTLEGGVHLIRVTAFMPPAIQPLAEAVATARKEGASGVILDLRGNPGGLALQAGAVAGMFMGYTETPLARVVSRDAELSIPVTPRPAAQRYEGPLAVLINQHTASTAEFFAASTQELGRARIFGVPSAGQALMATTHALPNGDTLYHPIAFVYGPKGTLLEGAGVQPDLLLEGASDAETIEAARCWILEQSGGACP